MTEPSYPQDLNVKGQAVPLEHFTKYTFPGDGKVLEVPPSAAGIVQRGLKVVTATAAYYEKWLSGSKRAQKPPENTPHKADPSQGRQPGDDLDEESVPFGADSPEARALTLNGSTPGHSPEGS